MTGRAETILNISNKDVYSQSDHFHQSFVDEDLLFIHFSKLDRELAKEVLAWRNHPEIRKWMYNKDVISEEDHFQFLQSLPRQRQRYYWLVKEGEKNLGVIDLSNYKTGESEWGFYLNPDYIGGGKAFHLFHYALHFFFHRINLKKVYGYVACENSNSLLLNELFDMKLAALIPKEHEGLVYWYAQYELSREAYLERDLTLGKLKRKLISSRNELRRKRTEIRMRQLLIQAFGRPVLPWMDGAIQQQQTNSWSVLTNTIQITHFCRLLRDEFSVCVEKTDILACQRFSDLALLLEDSCS